MIYYYKIYTLLILNVLLIPNCEFTERGEGRPDQGIWAKYGLQCISHSMLEWTSLDLNLVQMVICFLSFPDICRLKNYPLRSQAVLNWGV